SEFSQLLPYAVALGVNPSFVGKFATANTPIPSWWGEPKRQTSEVDHKRAWAWMGDDGDDSPPLPPSPPPAVEPRPDREKTRTTSKIRRLNTPSTPSPPREKTRTESKIRRLKDPTPPPQPQAPNQPAPERKREKTRTQSRIRRLSQAQTDTTLPTQSLKQILSTFQTFLKIGDEVFRKAPLFDTDDKEEIPVVKSEVAEADASS
ncbi:MAG: hypothetical protein AAF485_25805, partial [Chloroflexota bacterium]